MVKQMFVPSRGDIIWIDFDPVLAHEQRGRRPALVISARSYNAKTGLALTCPITSKAKKYPFEVMLVAQNVSGVVLTDHIRNLSWKNRNAEYIESTDREFLTRIISRIKDLIELDEAY